jgi:hypothetical protein
VSQPAPHIGERVELGRLMPLCRELDQLGLRAVTATLIEFAGRPVGDNVVCKCEYELRRYLRRERADLERAVAGLILLALKNPQRSEQG